MLCMHKSPANFTWVQPAHHDSSSSSSLLRRPRRSGTPNHRATPIRPVELLVQPGEAMVHAAWSRVAVAVPGERGCGIAGACGIAKRSWFGSFQWSGSAGSSVAALASPARSQPGEGLPAPGMGSDPDDEHQHPGHGIRLLDHASTSSRLGAVSGSARRAVRPPGQSRCRLQHLLSRLHGQDRLVAPCEIHPGILLLAWPLESRICDVRIARCHAADHRWAHCHRAAAQ